MHVRACDTNDGLLFLDLRHNKYLGIGKEDRDALSRAFNMSVEKSQPVDSQASPIVTSLSDAGILSTFRREQPAEAPSTIEPHAAIGYEEVISSTEPLDARDLLNFLIAFIRTRAELRFLSLERIVRATADRKSASNCDSRGICDYVKLRRKTVSFRRIRPLFYSSRNACLFDSLVLVHFLARYNLFPIWIVGVKARPFGAHSWVQEEALVLNDLPETVRAFTPILAV